MRCAQSRFDLGGCDQIPRDRRNGGSPVRPERPYNDKAEDADRGELQGVHVPIVTRGAEVKSPELRLPQLRSALLKHSIRAHW